MVQNVPAMVSIDDFKKSELRVAKVLEATRVEGSEKLLKLKLDLGEAGERQILSGIGKQYDPEALMGRMIIIVANLEPRQMMGLESQGMLLAASDHEVISILMQDKDVTPGSLIR